MKIAFFGASDLGWESCQALFDQGLDVVGVVTAPRIFDISWSKNPVTNVRYRSFEDISKQRHVPLFEIGTHLPMSSLRTLVKRMRPDLLVVVGWYHMIPKSVRDLAPLGAVGLHASLLPRYRGGAPLVWAMIDGVTRSGVTLFLLSDGVDDGPIVAQEDFPIAFRDSISDVICKSSEAGVRLIREYIPRIGEGTARFQAQDERLADRRPQRTPGDGIIDWTKLTTVQAYNWIRAQSRPYPGAFTYLRGERVTIWDAQPTEHRSNGTPGDLIEIPVEGGQGTAVTAGDGRLLRVCEVSTADGSVLNSTELARYIGLAQPAHFDSGQLVSSVPSDEIEPNGKATP